MQSWNDDRLDDLSHRVDGGFRELREEMRVANAELREEMRAANAELREEIKAGNAELRAEIHLLREEMRAGFARVDTRIDRQNYTLIAALVAVAAALISGQVG